MKLQENGITETGGEKQTVNVNEVNHPLATEAPEESRRSKRKKVAWQLADALNGCLCGIVLDRSSNGVLKCRQTGCETQWVSILLHCVGGIA